MWPLELTVARLQRCDERLCLALNAISRHLSVLHFLRAVSWLGNGIFWYALMLGLLLRDAAEALIPVVHMALVGVLGTATYVALKRRCSRLRLRLKSKTPP